MRLNPTSLKLFIKRIIQNIEITSISSELTYFKLCDATIAEYPLFSCQNVR